MKTFRKITALFIALTMIVAMCTNIAFAQDIKFSDVADDNVHYDAIYNLVNRGVLNGYEDGTFKPDNTITRAEFAKVIMVSELGDNNISKSAVANFSDTSGHWANAYIAAAVSAGIINGYPEGTFKPDNTVTYAEAVKMVVCALGYGPIIDTTLEPWYTDYIRKGGSIGATKNAISLAESGASRALVAQLIDNMEDCKRLVQTGSNSSGGSYGFEDEDEDTYESYGVLVGVYENSLVGTESTLTKSQVQIDDTIYYLEDDVDYKSLDRYVGYSVDFRVRKSGSREFVSKISANNGTKIETLDAYDVDEYTSGKLYYFVDEDQDETDYYKIDSNPYVIYNGYGVPSKYVDSEFIADIFDIDSGSIKLYNNDGDGDIDVVEVEKFETYFVGSVTKNTKDGTVTFTDKLGIQPKLTLYDDDVAVTKVTTAGGSESDALITSIVVNNVVSVAQPHESAPDEIPTIVKISTAYVSGSVDSMYGNYELVEIKGKDYVLAPCFAEFLAKDDNEETYGFKVDSTVKCFLDFNGYIVCTDVTETTASYGYLIDYLPAKGMDSSIEVMLLNTSGKQVEYKLGNTVNVNGESMSADKALEALLASSAVINKNKDSDYKVTDSVEQLITYELGTQNKEQVIKRIGTVGDGTDGLVKPYEFTYNKSVAKDIFTNCGGTSEKLLYVKSTNTFKSQDGQTQFTVRNSVIFYVPYGREDTDDYKKYTKTQFVDGEYYYVEPYDVESYEADYVVWYGDDGDDTADITVTSDTVIVVSTDPTLGTDGKTVYKLAYTKVGSTTVSEVYAESASVLNGIEQGDVIRIATNDTELDKVAMVYDYDEGKLYDETGKVVSDNYFAQKYGSDDDYYEAHVGVVQDIAESGEGNIVVSTKDDVVIYNVNSSTKYYKLDGKKSDPLTTDYDASAVATYKNSKDDASTVLVISITDDAKAVYILD